MQSKTSFRIPFLAIFTLIALVFAPALQSSVMAQAPLQVIATGLDNPRGLAFGSDFALYVAEAGRGGNSSLCLPQPDAPPGVPPRCYGPTGAVTRISPLGIQQRVVTGLPSLAGPDGARATGPHDIDFGFGNAWITIGLGADPAVRAPFEAAGINFGTLVGVLPNGQWSYVLDLASFETRANPDGAQLDSNPYGLRILPDRGLFVDAGGNALMNISLNGAISTLGVFPARFVASPFGIIPMDSVPTCVAVGPDANLYVGELTGFPFPIGGAQIYRVPLGGGTPVVVAGGFTNIIDLTIASNGTAYVLEDDSDSLLGPGSAGRLTRVNPDGSRTVLTNSLELPGGVAIGPDGALYVTNKSTSAGTGEVVRIQP